ncbi:MAG: hypothetical protein R6W91_01020 [Thermoplasmata archaeon]
MFKGEKRFEFRKQIPKSGIDKVYIYESSPTQNIVGWFSVNRIISGHPDYVWNNCKKEGGIGKDFFYSYCGNKDMVHAFEIKEIHKFIQPVNPFAGSKSFIPPQNFMYLNNSNAYANIPEEMISGDENRIN